MEELQIIYVNIDDLTPYDGNARRHDDVSAIKASIAELGFLDPIGIWGDQNIIVEGHGRVMAAKELGMTSVPCIRLDHLTDAQRRQYALTHNRSAELSEWNYLNLNEEIEELKDAFDLKSFGFNADEELEVKAPESFREFSEDLKTKHICPECGYEWN